MPDNKPKASRLIKDLSHVPGIIGQLGLSIAEAQKAFNHDYINNVRQILGMALLIAGGKTKETADGDGLPKVKDLTDEPKENFDKFAALFKDLLVAMAPSRYQFSQTTLDVRLDLAQSMDLSATAGLGGGFGGVTINAAFTIGYAYDYQAAAQCRTVINAIPADQTVFKPLLDNATKLQEKVLQVPNRAEVDTEITKLLRETYEALVGAEAPETVTQETQEEGEGGQGEGGQGEGGQGEGNPA